MFKYNENMQMNQNAIIKSDRTEYSIELFVANRLLYFNGSSTLMIWWPPSLSELTPIMFYKELTHLGLEVSIYFASY